MNPTIYEQTLAYELISHAIEGLEYVTHPDDLEAAVVATLATAIEIATKRKLRPIDEIFTS